jgi:hypothetical protein
MPQGWKGAANYWARVVSKVFEDLPQSDALVYQDDVLVHNRTFEDHYRTLGQVYGCLRYEGPYKVVEKVNAVVYVAEIDGERKRIHAVNMKPGVRIAQREHKKANRRGPVDEEWSMQIHMRGKCNKLPYYVVIV